MNKTPKDLDPSSMIQAIEANTIESFLTWTKWEQLELLKDDRDLSIISDIPFFIFNIVLRSETDKKDPGAVIDAAISRADSRQVPMGWWVGPTNGDPDIGGRLEEKGMFHAATLTGMAADLQKLEASLDLPPGITISEVRNEKDLEIWVQIMASVSEFPDFAQAAWLEMYRGMNIIEDSQWHLYLGSHNGTPVSTSALFLGGGVAGIHGVCTMPDFRGQGIGNAMTRAPLSAAHAKGYQTGVLFSSEMAVDMYRKLGFQEYGDGEIYVWMKSEESDDNNND